MEPSLQDCYFAWSLVFILVFGMVGFVRSENDLFTLIKEVGAYGAAGVVVAVPFALATWIGFQLGEHL